MRIKFERIGIRRTLIRNDRDRGRRRGASRGERSRGGSRECRRRFGLSSRNAFFHFLISRLSCRLASARESVDARRSRERLRRPSSNTSRFWNGCSCFLRSTSMRFSLLILAVAVVVNAGVLSGSKEPDLQVSINFSSKNVGKSAYSPLLSPPTHRVLPRCCETRS